MRVTRGSCAFRSRYSASSASFSMRSQRLKLAMVRPSIVIIRSSVGTLNEKSSSVVRLSPNTVMTCSFHIRYFVNVGKHLRYVQRAKEQKEQGRARTFIAHQSSPAVGRERTECLVLACTTPLPFVRKCARYKNLEHRYEFCLL